MQEAEQQIKGMMNEQSKLRDRLKPIKGRLKVLVRWAVYHDLIIGTSHATLDSQGATTRAQAAAILARFMTSFA